MRPIPKRLLIHTALYAREDSAGRWAEAAISNQQDLQFVRIEPSEEMVRDKNNAEIQSAATLFYDCKNSLPKDIKFAVDDVIFFNVQKLKIRSVEAMYDEKRLHHYEIELMKHA